MDICYIKTPLGIARIVGDDKGISSVSVLDTQNELSDVIPESLLDGVTQLKAKPRRHHISKKSLEGFVRYSIWENYIISTTSQTIR